MNRRVSIAEKLLVELDSKAYLSILSPNVCVTVLNSENQICFGKIFLLEKGAIVIICARNSTKMLVSIEQYEGKGNFHEIFYSFDLLSNIHKTLDEIPKQFYPFIGANIKKLNVIEQHKEYAVR